MSVGTFHDDKGELHGITVVVDTPGPEIWVGRCDIMTDQGIVLLDADMHSESEGGSKEDYLKRAAMVGVFKSHDRIVLESSQIASVRKLADL